MILRWRARRQVAREIRLRRMVRDLTERERIAADTAAEILREWRADRARLAAAVSRAEIAEQRLEESVVMLRLFDGGPA